MIDANTHHELKCLRTHIVDFIVYQLKNDLVTEKRASQLSQAILDRLTDDLNHEQIHQVIAQLEADFTEELKELESALAACETGEARKLIDKQILSQVSSGNIDAALATLDQYKIK